MLGWGIKWLTIEWGGGGGGWGVGGGGGGGDVYICNSGLTVYENQNQFLGL